MAAHAAGIDLVDVGARIALGERVELPPVDPDRVFFQFTPPAPVVRGCGRGDPALTPGA
ncbi:hypothetical protein [Actinosynnema sp. NPDC023587]|uniref:hypothetical protein n=1 Tax=Actinosynnema sp. NPDC023587 TaxID=3154695 RepID=UPI0034102F1B